jgi:hypothetical protein
MYATDDIIDGRAVHPSQSLISQSKVQKSEPAIYGGQEYATMQPYEGRDEPYTTQPYIEGRDEYVVIQPYEGRDVQESLELPVRRDGDASFLQPDRRQEPSTGGNDDGPNHRRRQEQSPLRREDDNAPVLNGRQEHTHPIGGHVPRRRQEYSTQPAINGRDEVYYIQPATERRDEVYYIQPATERRDEFYSTQPYVEGRADLPKRPPYGRSDASEQPASGRYMDISHLALPRQEYSTQPYIEGRSGLSKRPVTGRPGLSTRPSRGGRYTGASFSQMALPRQEYTPQPFDGRDYSTEAVINGRDYNTEPVINGRSLLSPEGELNLRDLIYSRDLDSEVYAARSPLSTRIGARELADGPTLYIIGQHEPEDAHVARRSQALEARGGTLHTITRAPGTEYQHVLN